MHGGKPSAGEVYGYTAWNRTQGYVSLHNPSDQPKTYTIKLDRAFGLVPDSGPFTLSSPLGADAIHDLPKTCAFGDTLTFRLTPGEIRIVDFDNSVRNAGLRHGKLLKAFTDKRRDAENAKIRGAEKNN